MNSETKIQRAQELINEFNLDGWLLYDFRRSNQLACEFLHLASTQLLTRRFFYWIPKKGAPCKILQAIESTVLDSVPGTLCIYRTWQDLENRIESILKGSKHIAMEYSPRNAIPYVSKVDAGTIEMIRGFGITVESSANLLQHFASIWDEHKFKLHLEAAHCLSDIVELSWGLIKRNLVKKNTLTEYDVQQFILEQMAARGFETSDPPICAVNEHSADPHYTPRLHSASPIHPNDFILIDLWCKKKQPEAVYADITRVGVAAAQPTSKQAEIFSIVRKAQKTATQLVQSRFLAKEPIRGWEVDQACRDVIIDAGYGEYFIHRTGHNIDRSDHGNGAHMDNFETHDDRLLLPKTCFSIEPGIYLPHEFGVRLEYDVFIHPDGHIQVTGGEQDQIQTLILDEE
jgi:Xaa-Pro dipeptidase